MGVLEQLTKISLIKKIGVLAAVMAVFGVVYWFLFYSEAMEEIERLEQENVQLVRERDDANRRRATYEKDRHRRDELKKSYGQQLRALPSDTEMSSFLNNLNTQAELVGLDIVSVKPKKEQASKYYARIPVELLLTGTYHQMAKFFYLVGNLDRIINIEDISFKVDSMEESDVVLSAKVLATTFRSVGAASDSQDRKKKRR